MCLQDAELAGCAGCVDKMIPQLSYTAQISCRERRVSYFKSALQIVSTPGAQRMNV